MSTYLTEDEIAVYCTIILNVTLADVTVASKLIEVLITSLNELFPFAITVLIN